VVALSEGALYPGPRPVDRHIGVPVKAATLLQGDPPRPPKTRAFMSALVRWSGAVPPWIVRVVGQVDPLELASIRIDGDQVTAAEVVVPEIGVEEDLRRAWFRPATSRPEPSA
jgi:hypothetical protein